MCRLATSAVRVADASVLWGHATQPAQAQPHPPHLAAADAASGVFGPANLGASNPLSSEAPSEVLPHAHAPPTVAPAAEEAGKQAGSGSGGGPRNPFSFLFWGTPRIPAGGEAKNERDREGAHAAGEGAGGGQKKAVGWAGGDRGGALSVGKEEWPSPTADEVRRNQCLIEVH